MKKIIIILIILTFFVGTVSADYQPSIEKKAIDIYNLETIISWSYDSSMLVAIYESNEHNNQLLEEQNHIIWVQTCYTPKATGVAHFGNISAWKKECFDAGYPVGIE